MNKIERIFFIAIIVISFIARFWQLDKFPVSLNWDEVSHGYNAYSLIQTGMDQWGAKWPIFNFRAYGDYPTTLNMYLSIPFIGFFGLNEWTTRSVSALCGFGLVIISYFIGKILFKNSSKFSLLLMFFVSISPWTFFTSRAVFQSTVAQFFLAIGVLFLLKAVTTNYKYLLPGLALFGLSMYGYHNTRIVVPLLTCAFIFIFHSEIKKIFFKSKKYFIVSLLIFITLVTPQVINIFNKEAQARSRWVFIINPASINQIEVSRNNFKGNKTIARIKYNKVTYFTQEVVKNYIGFINPKILFFDSTQNYQFNIPKTGVLFPICLPFFYTGLIFLIYKSIKNISLSVRVHRSSERRETAKPRGVFLFLISWFILGLVPAVITTGDFPIIRAMTVLPLPQIFTVYGFIALNSIFKKKQSQNILLIVFIGVSIFQSIQYLNNYFQNYSQKYSQSWQYGYKEAVTYIRENYDKYDQIIFTKKYGEPHEYVLFYMPINPQKYLSDSNKVWDFHADWYWVDKFDKFQFVNDWEVIEKTKNLNNSKILLVASTEYPKENTNLLKEIKFLDGTVAFNILEFR